MSVYESVFVTGKRERKSEHLAVGCWEINDICHLHSSILAVLYGFTLLYDSLTLLVIHRHACVLRRFSPVIDVTIVVSVTLLNPTSQYGFIETERTPWKKKNPNKNNNTAQQ